ncbi:MAG: PHP domain-containing protein [Eubacteriales bacterium]
MNQIDLHVHSTESDGTYTPTELVNYALEKGLSAMALTDHDTTAGLSEAMAAAQGTSLEIIPGIEFSTHYNTLDIHILGLDIQYEDTFFQEQLLSFQQERCIRNEKMCQKLREHGIGITYAQLLQDFPDAVMTRSHFAMFLLEYGYVRSPREAFDRYIGDHAPCFVPRNKVTPAYAIQLIHQVGGIAILAHPLLYHMSDANVEKLIQELKEAGLDGIEAIYSTHSPAQERQVRAYAKKYCLKLSGGSDFHGSVKPQLDLGCGYGKLMVPDFILEDLRKKA